MCRVPVPCPACLKNACTDLVQKNKVLVTTEMALTKSGGIPYTLPK